MADSNRVGMGVTDEVIWGELPANPVFDMIGFNTSPFGTEPETIASARIRPDRNVADLVRVGERSAGSLTSELSYGNLDHLWRGLICNPWTLRLSAPATAAGAAAFTVGGPAPQFTKGMLVRAAGFGTTVNNTLAKVSATGADNSVPVAGSGVVAEASAPASARLTLVGWEGATGDVAATINGITATGTSGPLNTLGLQPGDWILVGGKADENRFAVEGINGWARISTISATALTFDRLPDDWAVNNGAGKKIRFTVGDRLRNGVARYSYSFLQNYTDLDYSEVFTGMMVGSGSLSFRAGAMIETAVALEGRNSTTLAGIPQGATQRPILTNPVMNAASNVARIGTGGLWALGGNYVMSADMQITNNLRDKRAIAVRGSIGKGYGQWGLSGSFSTYFDDPSLYAALRRDEEGSLDIPVIDADGAGYMFDAPRTKYTRGAPEAQGANADVMLPIQYQALVHRDLGYAFHVGRYSETV